MTGPYNPSRGVYFSNNLNYVLKNNGDIFANNMTINGNIVLNGTQIINTPRLVLSNAALGIGDGWFQVAQGSQNAASLYWNSAANVWQMSNVSTNVFSTMLSTANLADSITNTSLTAGATANSIVWALGVALASSNVLAPNVNAAYSAANAAANLVAVYANGGLGMANANINFINTASVLVSVQANGPNHWANVSFTANVANLSGALLGNPTGLIGPVAVNGGAGTAMKSDGAPALNLTALFTGANAWKNDWMITGNVSIANTGFANLRIGQTVVNAFMQTTMQTGRAGIGVYSIQTVGSDTFTFGLNSSGSNSTGNTGSIPPNTAAIATSIAPINVIISGNTIATFSNTEVQLNSSLSVIGQAIYGDSNSILMDFVTSQAPTTPPYARIQAIANTSNNQPAPLCLQSDLGGSVGIAVTIPTQALDVAGTIRLRSLGAGWAALDSGGNVSSGSLPIASTGAVGVTKLINSTASSDTGNAATAAAVASTMTEATLGVTNAGLAYSKANSAFGGFSHAANGYDTLPNGLIIQWGFTSSAGGNGPRCRSYRLSDSVPIGLLFGHCLD